MEGRRGGRGPAVARHQPPSLPHTEACLLTGSGRSGVPREKMHTVSAPSIYLSRPGPFSPRCGRDGSGRRPALRKEGEWRAAPVGKRAALGGGEGTGRLCTSVRGGLVRLMRFLCYDLHINFLKIGYLFPN